MTAAMTGTRIERNAKTAGGAEVRSQPFLCFAHF
jgi:hypothetical protein